MSSSAQLYDQTGGITTSGVISAYMTDKDTLVQSADDFTVPAGADWNVTSVSVHGFRNGTGANMTSMVVEIFSDATGPGTIIYTEDITLSGAGVPVPNNDTTIVLPLAITQTLSPGTYWLSVYGDTESTCRWNWTTHGSTAIGNIAVLQDTEDFFGVGATTWTAVATLGLVDPDFAFIIGETVGNVGISELADNEVSVYPNPAAEVLNVAVESANVEQVFIYNVDGKLVVSELNTSIAINIADLPAGAYVVEFSTINGVSRK